MVDWMWLLREKKLSRIIPQFPVRASGNIVVSLIGIHLEELLLWGME
jgi:hypothetical protein